MACNIKTPNVFVIILGVFVQRGPGGIGKPYSGHQEQTFLWETTRILYLIKLSCYSVKDMCTLKWIDNVAIQK